MGESAKRHEEDSNLIKEIQASTDAAIRNQGASIKTLEIKIGQMSKKGSYGPQFSEAYSKASHIDESIPQKEKDPGFRWRRQRWWVGRGNGSGGGVVMMEMEDDDGGEGEVVEAGWAADGWHRRLAGDEAWWNGQKLRNGITRMYRDLSLRTSGPLQDPTTATITTIIITNSDGIWRVKTFQENNIPRIKVNNWEELAGELML
ncbi:hypothetical protein Tco_0572745 [Tanacetum coccineum]